MKRIRNTKKDEKGKKIVLESVFAVRKIPNICFT